MPASDITLYTSPTSNGHKVSVVLEELGLPYNVQAIDLVKEEQKQEWFLKINPNGRIPAITDGAQRIFESGAIMQYLVDKYDTERKISYAPGTPEYYEQLSWLMWQVSGLGPMQGQANHFTCFAPVRSDYSIQRYKNETKRLYSTIEARLRESPYLAGEKYTIADIACVGWIRVAPVILDIDLNEWPTLKKWLDSILQREAVKKGMLVPPMANSEEQMIAFLTEKKKEIMAKGSTDIQ
ncbi:glutathione S-transferase [Aspergillus ambiguus]|uniref:glutathione S-transferase family protein n=1 Tax=Aspergillus ambiguus TaxID=176160 RepID=UPI003CCD728F